MVQKLNKAKSSVLNVIFTKEFLFLIAIIFSSYDLFGMHLTYIILGIYVIYKWIICGRRFILLDKSFFVFIIVVLIHEVIMVFVHADDAKTIFNNIIGAIISVVIVGTMSTEMKLDSFKKAYYLIAIIVSIGLLYQAVLVYGLGKSVTPIQLIPSLISHDTEQWGISLMRPMSCFVEPQAYATFMIPVIYFLLNEKKFVWALVGTTCILLCTSSLGILMCAIMWSFVLLDRGLPFHMKFLVMVLAITFLILVFNSDIFEFAFNKIENIDTSSDARLSQGFIIYDQMPSSDQIFGIGKRSLVDYILSNNIYVPRMKYATNVGKWSYVTTIAGMLIYYGYVGIMSFAIFVVGQLKKRNFMIIEFIILLVAISFGQSILFNIYFVLFYTILFCLDKDKHKYITIKF